MNTAVLPRIHAAETVVSATTQKSLWLAWAGLIAGACIATGVYWDISWHMSIGRDTFWTPAHLLIQFGAVLSGLGSAWAIFRTTLGRDNGERASTVSVLGFHAPLGAFVLAWGSMAMLTSAPFDNWWHNAYGLDVKIISPPHMLLALGITGINWGAVFLIVAAMNRAQDAQRTLLQYMLLAMGGFIVVQTMTLKLEWTSRVFLHSAISYVVISAGLLLLVEALARASGHRWARTIVTGTYTLFGLLTMWVLPLFPAQPKLGPVYQDITHMVPLPFPILLVVPAFVLDLLWPMLREPKEWAGLSRAVLGILAVVLAGPFILLNFLLDALTKRPKLESWNKWLLAAMGGTLFTAILIVVEWPAAGFLMSKAAHNWALAPTDVPYFALPTSPSVRRVFVQFEKTPVEFWVNMGLAFVVSTVSMRIGITYGNWMSKLRR